MKTAFLVSVALFGVSVAAASFAQTDQQGPASGMGAGPGMGPGSGMEPGAGQKRKAAHFGWSNSNTAGWTLMTSAERTAHQAKMRAVTTYDECKALSDENHQAMEARAKERGVRLTTPRQNGCAVMKARGFIE